MTDHPARLYALLAHGVQMYGNEPYRVHLDEVASIVEETGGTPDQITAAYLHDVLEDVPRILRMDLEMEFSRDVANMVWAMSGEGTNRKTRVVSVYPKLLSCTSAIPVKMADRLANWANAHKKGLPQEHMYRKEYAVFRDTLGEFGSPILCEQLDLLAMGSASG